MGSLNRVYAMGNLTKDPQTKQLESGTAVTDLRLAISESYTNQKCEKKEIVCYVDVVVWGREAEVCNQYLRKGSPVLVEGRLQMDTWEKDGQKRSLLKIRADHVQFLGESGGKKPVVHGADESEAGIPNAAATTNRTEKPAPETDDDGIILPF